VGVRHSELSFIEGRLVGRAKADLLVHLGRWSTDGKTSLSFESSRWNEEPTSSSEIDKGNERSMERREWELETMLAIFSSRVSRHSRYLADHFALEKDREEGRWKEGKGGA